MKKVPKIKPSNDPWFDELELLAKEFPANSLEEKISSTTDQFEQEMRQLSVQGVSIPRDESYFFGE